MELTPRTSILALFKAHDLVLTFLVAVSSERKNGRAPARLANVGRVATLERVAAMARVPLDRLTQGIRVAMDEGTGAPVPVNTESGAADVSLRRYGPGLPPPLRGRQ